MLNKNRWTRRAATALSLVFGLALLTTTAGCSLPFGGGSDKPQISSPKAAGNRPVGSVAVKKPAEPSKPSTPAQPAGEKATAQTTAGPGTGSESTGTRLAYGPFREHDGFVESSPLFETLEDHYGLGLSILLPKPQYAETQVVADFIEGAKYHFEECTRYLSGHTDAHHDIQATLFETPTTVSLALDIGVPMMQAVTWSQALTLTKKEGKLVDLGYVWKNMGYSEKVMRRSLSAVLRAYSAIWMREGVPVEKTGAAFNPEDCDALVNQALEYIYPEETSLVLSSLCQMQVWSYAYNYEKSALTEAAVTMGFRPGYLESVAANAPGETKLMVLHSPTAGDLGGFGPLEAWIAPQADESTEGHLFVNFAPEATLELIDLSGIEFNPDDPLYEKVNTAPIKTKKLAQGEAVLLHAILSEGAPHSLIRLHYTDSDTQGTIHTISYPLTAFGAYELPLEYLGPITKEDFLQ